MQSRRDCFRMRICCDYYYYYNSILTIRSRRRNCHSILLSLVLLILSVTFHQFLSHHSIQVQTATAPSIAEAAFRSSSYCRVVVDATTFSSSSSSSSSVTKTISKSHSTIQQLQYRYYQQQRRSSFSVPSTLIQYHPGNRQQLTMSQRPQTRSMTKTILRGGSSSTTNDLDSTSNISIANDNATSTEASISTNITTSIASPIATTPSNRWVQIRKTIFPIYTQQETMKFLYIGSIKFFIILALTLTRDTKDTIIVTQCGAEAIAFLKIYGVLPIATLYIAYYSKLSNIVTSKQLLFYITCIPFFLFFAVYDLFIYRNVHILHPSIDTVRNIFSKIGIITISGGGGGISVLMNIISHWTSALFYIMAEIYSSVSVGLLFWSFANDVVPIEQAKRFYPLFAQMSGLAPVLAGQYMVHYASRAPNFAVSLHRLTIAVTFAGIMICLSYYQSCKYVESTEGIKISGNDDNTTATSVATTTKKKKKQKLSMTESAKFLAGSEYLRLIAMLVLGYGLSINFTEIIWKSLVKKLYPNPLDYQRFMGNFSSIVGLCTCIVIFFGVHVIRILGWRVGAMATPSIMAVISIPFFICILLGITDQHPLRLQTAVLCGTILSLVSKTSKYALFDPTTQMAYIPLDEESKVKGKAAIDVLGSRIGKSGGSFIQQGLVFGFGSILNAAPAVATIYYGVLFTWISAANRLSALFHSTQQEKQNESTITNSTAVSNELAAEENSESKKDK